MVKAEVHSLRRRFNSMKMSTIQCLERCCIAVATVVYILTEIRALDQHRVFLEKKHKVLFRSKNHLELFTVLNFYWNYLAYDLLYQLLEQLTQKDDSFETIRADMTTYKTDLKKFRQCTRLDLFCRAEGSDSEDNGTDDDPPPGFRKIVVRHKWPNTVTLEDVERFRKRYMRKYDLQKCAMMLHSIRSGSFTVTWFVPVTVIDILRKKRAVEVYKEFEVSRLEIYVQATAVCVYQTPAQRQVSFMQHTV